ncbi:flagellar motor protein MotB [Sporosarcina sp. HYO08]|uniref:flagellar motor protein MotB n=1 Tax=Sporosarcina sp. HYO08 TaxID=1759557 RepID=UPI00079504DE|nr:flagellar motor protein MotB [Sporosarcina sp. HYO08]KXH78823.1 flagellar motor protein MotB [Sporosarcina sp. HYO08]
MSRRRKRKRKDHTVNESWLLPYADLMTMLLALFIVLFSSSSIDSDKFSKMSTVFSEVFDGGTGIMDNSARGMQPITNPNIVIEHEEFTFLEDQKSLAEIQNRVNDYISSHQLEDQFETLLTDEGLLVTIRDNILFSTGEAKVSAEHADLADDIAELLVFDPPRHIVVTGHTDNVPIQTSEFDSNWELSAMRAVNFLKIIVENESIDPIYYSAKGFGEYQPIASNDTEAGRSKNRRVEVLIEPLVLKDGTINQ